MKNNKFQDTLTSTIKDTQTRFTNFFTPKMVASTVICAIILSLYGLLVGVGWYDKICEFNTYLGKVIDSIVWLFGGMFGGLIVDLILALSLRGNQKSMTILRLIHSLLKYVVGIVVLIGLLIVWLGQAYISGIIGGVGVVALIIGLGAQKLIGDIIAGVFMVFEGNIKVGDIVTIGDFRGVVEEIGIRSTILVSDGGDKKVVTNSTISDFINMSNELSLAIVLTTIHYDIPVEKTCEVVQNNIQRIKDKISTLQKLPEFKGVESMADSGYVIKIIGYCNEEDRFQTQRDMVKELMIILQENDITLAYPHIEISQQN